MNSSNRWQANVLPAGNMEESSVSTRSERILLDYQKLKRINARDLRDLIQDLLHHPDFNTADVDHDMHARLMRAVPEGEIEVHDMWQEGDCSMIFFSYVNIALFLRNVKYPT